MIRNIITSRVRNAFLQPISNHYALVKPGSNRLFRLIVMKRSGDGFNAVKLFSSSCLSIQKCKIAHKTWTMFKNILGKENNRKYLILPYSNAGLVTVKPRSCVSLILQTFGFYVMKSKRYGCHPANKWLN